MNTDPPTDDANSPLEGWSKTGVVNNEHPSQETITIDKYQIKLNPILDLPYNPELKLRAAKLRQARNLPEVLFWTKVNNGKFHGIDFDRQRVIGNFIADFYAKKLGLVVEIDGVSHKHKEEYDTVREACLLSLGLRSYRIKVIDVMKRMAQVLRGLEDFIILEYAAET